MLRDIVLSSLAVAIPILLAIGAAIGVMFWARWSWRKRFREPFREPILRPSGWGCLERRADAVFDLASIGTGLFVMWGMFAIAGHLAHWTPLLWLLPFMGIATVYWLFILKKTTLRARTERLGFLGECAVSEAMTPLIAKGWSVYHDLPMTHEVMGRTIGGAPGLGGRLPAEFGPQHPGSPEHGRLDAGSHAHLGSRCPEGDSAGPRHPVPHAALRRARRRIDLFDVQEASCRQEKTVVMRN